MNSISETQDLILQHTEVLGLEFIPLLRGLGRVLGETVIAPWDMPFADNSAMDGYTFSHEALESNYLQVTGFLPAGMERTVPVLPGEAIRIMTGAIIPPGCDTVIPLEEVESDGAGIRLRGRVKPGSHIRRKAGNLKSGDHVLSAGSRLLPGEIGMLASLGRTTVSVHRVPNIAIIATGDELVEPGTAPSAAKRVNSNTYSLAAQVIEAGANPVVLGIARDTKKSTMAKILAGLDADIIITSGGVSVGEKDYVKEVIEELGGEILLWKVNMKPGKPFAFALLKGKPVYALPGNPVAAMMTFELFVRPAILKMTGRQRIFRPVVKATVTKELKNKGDRPHLVLSSISLMDGQYYVTTTADQNSANLSIMSQNNCFIQLAPGESILPGSLADVTVFNREFEMRVLCQ